jgi:hypothetical protein
VSSNLDLIRSIYAEWERGDFSSSHWADPGIELAVMDGPSPGTTTGLNAMASRWGEVLSAYDDFRAIPESFHELDDERVLVLIRNRGRGKASGVEVDAIQRKSVNLFYVRAGKVVRLETWWDRERGLAELGLTEKFGS